MFSRSTLGAARFAQRRAFTNAAVRRSGGEPGTKLEGAFDNAFNRERLAVKAHAASTAGMFLSVFDQPPLAAVLLLGDRQETKLTCNRILAQAVHLRRHPRPHRHRGKHLGPVERALGAPEPHAPDRGPPTVRVPEPADKGVPVEPERQGESRFLLDRQEKG